MPDDKMTTTVTWTDPASALPAEGTAVLLKVYGSAQTLVGWWRHARWWVAKGTARGGVPYGGRVTGWRLRD